MKKEAPVCRYFMSACMGSRCASWVPELTGTPLAPTGRGWCVDNTQRQAFEDPTGGIALGDVVTPDNIERIPLGGRVEWRGQNGTIFCAVRSGPDQWDGFVMRPTEAVYGNEAILDDDGTRARVVSLPAVLGV